MKLAIVDYGLGNVASVAGAIASLGYESVLTADPDVLAAADKIILPGVGAFRDGMANLHERNLVTPLNEIVVQGKKPILGICLGFQLLARESEEFGSCEGLNWIEATVVRLAPADKSLRVPHVGWNELHYRAGSILFEGVPDESLFYFVHSYHLRPESYGIVTGTCPYGGDFVAAINQGNIYGTQFHPEKSQRHGLAVLQNFIEKG